MKQTEKTTTMEEAPPLAHELPAPARGGDASRLSHGGEAAPTPPHSPRRRFYRNVAWTVMARLLMLAGSLVSSIVVARVLGAEGLGALAVINVTMALALQLGCAGLPSANTYFIALDRGRLAPLWANALLFGLSAGSTLALIVAGLSVLRPDLFGGVPLNLILIAALSIPFQLVTFLGLNVFLGIERIAHFNLLDALSQFLVLVNAVVALIVLGSGLRTLVALNTAASVLICAAVVWMIGRVIAGEGERQRFRPDTELFKQMARYGVKFHVAVVASLIIFRADLLIVNHFRGQAEAGSYNVASQMAMLLVMLPGVIATLIFPRVTSGQGATGEQLIMRATRHTAFIMFFVCLVAVPCAFLLPYIYGPAFGDVPVQLLILLPGIYLVGVESVLVQYFSGTGLPAAIPLFWLVTLLLNILLNLSLVPAYGARAAALSSTISYALIFLLVTFYFRRRTGQGLSGTFILRGGELRGLFKHDRRSSTAGQES